jgi:predicted secreted protein
VSGFGLFDTKRVQLGDVVEIRLPMEPSKGERWRLASYDSVMLRILERPTLVDEGSGRSYLLIRFEARVQGETEVLLRNTASATEDTRRYFVQIW